MHNQEDLRATLRRGQSLLDEPPKSPPTTSMRSDIVREDTQVPSGQKPRFRRAQIARK